MEINKVIQREIESKWPPVQRLNSPKPLVETKYQRYGRKSNLNPIDNYNPIPTSKTIYSLQNHFL